MAEVIRIGLDTSKGSLRLHGVDAAEAPVLKRTLTRGKLLAFVETQPACLVALEACGASRHWARTLTALGHSVRLIAPQHVKPSVPRSNCGVRNSVGSSGRSRSLC